jgi:ferritin
MLSKAVQDAINEQIKNELYSAYLYLSMAAYCESINLPGFAHWMRRQYEEEVTHGLKFFDYLTERGARVTLKAIDQPPADFESPLAMFQQTLEHEQKVTGLINDIYALAVKENDYASQVELQWFITEQVEEEKSASEIVEQLKMMGEHGPSLIMMDRHLASR